MVLGSQYTRKLKTILQSRFLFKIVAVVFIIYSLLVTNLYTYKSKFSFDNKRFVGIITKYNIDGNKLTIYLKDEEVLIVTYYLKSEEEKHFYQDNLLLGDKVEVEGELNEASNNTLPNIFNYKKYLYYNKIYYLIEADKIRKIENNTKISYYIKNKIRDRVENIDATGYLKIFILGDKKGVDNEVMSNYQVNGVSHLFSISGMHISLLASIILFLFKKVSYNNKLNYFMVILFLGFYLFLTDCSPSILRATIMFILLAINKCYNLKISSLDIVLLVLVIVIIINPFYIYNVGFQFSYLISFTLILLSSKIRNINGSLKRNLYISLVCFLVSLPISIYNFYQVNILSIFLNIILIPLVSIIVYPLSLMVFIFPFLGKVFEISVVVLEYVNSMVSSVTIFQLVLSKPNLLLIIVYYFVIYLSLYNKKWFIILFLLVFVHKISIYFDNSLEVLVIDVGQGDSIFIKLPYNKGNILIDTGGIMSYNNEEWSKRNNTYNITKNKTIPYLKSIGISKLDYLILTHGDYDHMGEAISLVNNFKLEKVILNCGSYNDLENELIKVLEKKNIKYYSCIKELNVDNNKLYFLNTRIYDNENDNSNVIYFNYNNYKFLFMGDAGIDREKDILENYNLKKIDFLKVGHHGSNTSTSEEFINSIDPKYSLISVGENNRYGHPKEIVLETLSNSKIYRTDIDGSVMLKVKNNKLEIKTCAP